jgi:hypothetical protein
MRLFSRSLFADPASALFTKQLLDGPWAHMPIRRIFAVTLLADGRTMAHIRGWLCRSLDA